LNILYFYKKEVFLEKVELFDFLSKYYILRIYRLKWNKVVKKIKVFKYSNKY